MAESATTSLVREQSMSLQELVQLVTGVPACPSDVDEVVVELATLILLLLITHPANQGTVDTEGRKKSLQDAVANGDLDESLDDDCINTIASRGFAATSNGVECRVCKQQALRERVRQLRQQRQLSSLLTNHSKDCLFLLMCSSISNAELRRSEPYVSLFNHLRHQWTTTKVFVASDMGYSPNLILAAMTRQFQQHRQPFACAGDLIGSALDLELEGRPYLSWDVSVFLRRLTASVRSRNVVSHNVGNRQWSSNRSQLLPVKAAPSVSLHEQNSPQSSIESRIEENGSSVPSHERNTTDNSLREETLKLMYRWRCKSCGKQDADQLLMDCGHLALCSCCREKHNSCPICQVPIVLAPIRVFAA